MGAVSPLEALKRPLRGTTRGLKQLSIVLFLSHRTGSVCMIPDSAEWPSLEQTDLILPFEILYAYNLHAQQH